VVLLVSNTPVSISGQEAKSQIMKTLQEARNDNAKVLFMLATILGNAFPKDADAVELKSRMLKNAAGADPQWVDAISSEANRQEQISVIVHESDILLKQGMCTSEFLNRVSRMVADSPVDLSPAPALGFLCVQFARLLQHHNRTDLATIAVKSEGPVLNTLLHCLVMRCFSSDSEASLPLWTHAKKLDFAVSMRYMPFRIGIDVEDLAKTASIAAAVARISYMIQEEDDYQPHLDDVKQISEVLMRSVGCTEQGQLELVEALSSQIGHPGYSCSRCQMTPIVGPRFAAEVAQGNPNLCILCKYNLEKDASAAGVSHRAVAQAMLDKRVLLLHAYVLGHKLGRKDMLTAVNLLLYQTEHDWILQISKEAYT